jgi:uncharacterized protein with NRDE domain
MCLLALFFRVAEDAPVVVGANREEFYARGGEPPRILDGPVRAVAGVDPLAGGTWLGVNAHGVLVAVTNRGKSDVPPSPRSRGLLARDLLATCTSARAAADRAARELDAGSYAGCNLLCADADAAVVVEASDWLRVRPLPPGVHVVTNHDVNDGQDARTAYALGWLGECVCDSGAECVAALKALCGQADVCFRLADRGTVSSSLVVLRPPADGLYLHAQGPPDQTPYADYSHLLREIRPSTEY